MRCLAIIPARAGSKGVKDKNIREICGKPLILYTIESAVNSGVFDEVMVSTDSEKYAEILNGVEGVSIPFFRSETTADDFSSSWDVAAEVLYNYQILKKDFDMFCILQPTSPLRSVDNIREAYSLFCQKKAYSIVSVCELGHSLNICNTLPDDHSMIGFLKDKDKYLRQMNPVYYRLNGAIYMCNTKAFFKYKNIYEKRSYAYIMKTLESIDIDTEDDLLMAEFLLRRKLNSSKNR